MRQHVPFAHRNRPPGPIYIGFEQPVSIQRRKGRFNWAGFTGLMLALISPLTAFIIAPLALLFSLIGLRRAPRGMAGVGAVLAAGGTTILSLMLIAGFSEYQERQHRRHLQHVAAVNQPLIEETVEILDDVKSELREYRSAHSDYLPELREGMQLTVQYLDAWEQELFYEPTDEGCLIRSAGPDGEFHTADDVTATMAGVPGPIPVQ